MVKQYDIYSKRELQIVKKIRFTFIKFAVYFLLVLLFGWIIFSCIFIFQFR